MRIDIKPLTVNQCWQGRRYKTDKYKKYESDVLSILPKYDIPDGPLCLCLEVGLSNKLADVDNIAKPFIDILQKRYGFNDSRIYMLVMVKQIVKKGSEYIDFELTDADI